MSLSNEIERATQIPFIDDNARFVPITRRPPRIPTRPARNAELLEERSGYTTTNGQHEDTVQNYNLNPAAVSAQINMALGMTLSNSDVEEYWIQKQVENSYDTTTDVESNINISSRSMDLINESKAIDNNKVDESDTKEESIKSVEDDDILEKCKLSKNAAIKGLIKNKKISVKNLVLPNKSKGDKKCKTSVKDVNMTSCSEQEHVEELVPLPEDPEVLVRPIQAFGTIDKDKFPHIDFTVDRIGEKKAVTPQQYYTYGIDDTMFDFVKPDKKRT